MHKSVAVMTYILLTLEDWHSLIPRPPLTVFFAAVFFPRLRKKPAMRGLGTRLGLVYTNFATVTSCTESRPALHWLQKLTSVEGRVVAVADRVAAYWEKLAQALHFERSVVKQVKRREKTREAACVAVLKRWLEGKGRRPVNWDTLLTCLNEIGQRDLCEEVILLRREGIRLDDGRIVIYF